MIEWLLATILLFSRWWPIYYIVYNSFNRVYHQFLLLWIIFIFHGLIDPLTQLGNQFNCQVEVSNTRNKTLNDEATDFRIEVREQQSSFLELPHVYRILWKTRLKSLWLHWRKHEVRARAQYNACIYMPLYIMHAACSSCTDGYDRPYHARRRNYRTSMHESSCPPTRYYVVS